MKVKHKSYEYDWKNKKKWKYKGGDDPTKDPKYIRDRNKLFKENGNGWWWTYGVKSWRYYLENAKKKKN